MLQAATEAPAAQGGGEAEDLIVRVVPHLRPVLAGGVNPPGLRRGEVLALVALSIALHTLAAVQVARARTADSVPRAQQVVIEMVRPPVQPPVVPPQAAQPERPRPVVRKAEPRVLPKLEPVAPPQEAPPPSEELPALPEGDDPALASAGGTNVTSAAPIATAPAPEPAQGPPGPIIAAQEGANYLKNPRPPYPELAMRRGWQGEVLLRVQVSPAGRPVNIAVARSSGRDLLDQAAITAVRDWSFVPARQGDQPIAGWVNVPIVFNLQ